MTTTTRAALDRPTSAVDALTSWRDGATRQAVVSFVEQT
jgi:hypothetical protein